ncbi:MAG: ATP synthase subunit I [Desulfobacterales bacterium]
MKSVRTIQKKYCSRAMMFSICISLGFILLGEKAIGKGIVLGTLFSIINFVLIGEMLPARFAKGKRKTFFISLGSIFFRYLLLAIPIVPAVKYDTFNLYATVAALFSVQLMIIAEHILGILPLKRKQQA